MNAIAVSIVIPYYNKWPRFKYTLHALSRLQAEDMTYEIIVVDDGSEPALSRQLEAADIAGLDRLLVHRTANQGRALARNEGARLARGRLLLFMDDDMLVPPDFILQHAEAHARRAEPCFVHGRIYDLLALTPYLDPESGERFAHLQPRPGAIGRVSALLTLEQVFGDWERFASRHRRLARLERLIRRTLADASLARCHWVGCVGGNLSIDKALFNRVGGFDQGFCVWGGEDFELGYRLILAGARAVDGDKAEAYHMTHAHKSAEAERRQSRDYFLARHGTSGIHHLYEFLEQRLQEEDLILLWRKEIQHGEDSSSVGS